MEPITIEAQGERAVIAPDSGCQCLSYSVSSLDVIAGPASMDALREHPFRSGIPILFPWPGRVAHARFAYGGRELSLPVNEPARGHAIHGLTWNCAFRVKRRGPYYLSTELDSSTDANLSAIWPYPFVMETDYEIGDGMRIRMRIRNTGSSSMPFGLGAHPYFHLPLGGRGKREDVIVQIPSAIARWPLDGALIPSGAPEPVQGKFDLRAPRALGEDSYDDAFQLDPSRDPSKPCARMISPAMGIAIDMLADASVGEFVLYAPPGNPVIAMEPYTCAPDAFNLARRGIASGARELAPGASFETGFEFRLGAP